MRTILISGATRGIGKSIALRALEDGHRISLGVRNKDSIKGTKLDPGISGKDRIHLFNYDALDEISAKEWVQSTLEKFNEFDSVINSAGIFKDTKFLYKKEEQSDIERLWKTNLLGPWTLMKESWKNLILHKESRAIFLVSMSGKRSKSDLAGYTISKFALMGLCQTIRNEGWEHGLRVTAICPGWVNTDMAKSINRIDKKEMTQPDDIASIISKLLELPNSCIPFELSINCVLEK